MKRFSIPIFILSITLLFSACVKNQQSDPNDTGAASSSTNYSPNVAAKPRVNGEGYQGALKIKISRVSLASVVSPTGAITTVVTITGENFAVGATVRINGLDCNGVSVAGDNSLQCSVNAEIEPETSGPAITVVVNAPDRDPGEYSTPSTAPLPPVLTSIFPTTGLTLGGSSVTLTGENFETGATVAIGSQSCTQVAVASATSLACLIPAVGTAGVVNVRVTNPDGQSATRENAFTYQYKAPTVSGVSPNTGLTTGGTAITITGANFVAAPTVLIGGNVCGSVNRVNSTTITCSTPGALSAGAVAVRVTNSDGQFANLAGAFSYAYPAPTYISVNPNVGLTTGGTAIGISGDYFLPSPIVHVGGNLCTNVTRPTAQVILCNTPAGTAGLASVKVTNTDGQFVQIGNAFQYVYPAPTISNVSPNSGVIAGGTAITITGTNFLTAPTVDVGSYPCTNVLRPNATTITCNTPGNSAGSYAVKVTNSDGQFVSYSGFTYLPGGNLGSWEATATTTVGARQMHTAVWTGSTMIVFGGLSNGFQLATGGRYDPITDSWQSTSLSGAPSTRCGHSAVWTGAKMIVWGGFGPGLYGDGFSYDPIGDAWIQLPAHAQMPSARAWHSAVWTGGQMIIWGGFDFVSGRNDGARYNPTNGSWTTLSSTDAPSARYNHPALWTGSKMIIWGGSMQSGSDNTGALYDLAANTWSAMSTSGAPNGRDDHSAVWTGTAMIVWGGRGGAGGAGDGAIYHPVGNSWSPMSLSGAPAARKAHSTVWTGSKMIVFGGVDSATYFANGGVYDFERNTWSGIEATGAPTLRAYHAAVWTGSKMVVWGGYNGAAEVNTGAKYSLPPDIDSNTWTAMETTGAPTITGSVVWTGSKMITWGGYYGGPVQTGAQYDLVNDSWSPTTTLNAPSAREGNVTVWTGAKMIIWGGGYDGGPSYNDGKFYYPQNDQWINMNTVGAPSARRYAGAVWTGSKLIVWAGHDPLGVYGDTNTGGVYDDSTGLWTATQTVGAPAPRRGIQNQTVWTGSKMIMWGGFRNGVVPTANDMGGIYDPSNNSWTLTSTANASAYRESHVCHWTGSKMILWGGYRNGTGNLSDGKLFDPNVGVGGTWTDMNLAGAPTATVGVASVWTGAKMLVFGGDYSSPSNSFKGYDPASNAWASLSNQNGPAARVGAAAVWTGSKMIVWGGAGSLTNLDSGALYTP